MTSESPKEVFWNGMDYASTMPFAGGLSYTLTANAQAMVAAAYDDATEVVAHDHVCDAIRARTPADAQAALDALLQAEREAGRIDGLREAAEVVDDYPRVAPEEHEWIHYDEQIEYSQRCILALIKKETGQ